MIVRTSAKSRLMRPGIVIQVGDPLHTLAQDGRPRGSVEHRGAPLNHGEQLSLGMTISVSTTSRRRSMPSVACPRALRASKSNGG